MPQYFTNAEYADIHFVYGFCNGNANAAVQEYRRRFPNRRIPNDRVFTGCELLIDYSLNVDWGKLIIEKLITIQETMEFFNYLM